MRSTTGSSPRSNARWRSRAEALRMSGKAVTDDPPAALPMPAIEQPRSWRSILLAPKLAGWATVLILIVAWEAGVRLGHVSPLYLPGPIETAAALYDLFTTGHLQIGRASCRERV